MNEKKIPFSKKDLEKIIAVYPTPFHIYIEKEIGENIERLKKAFSWAPDFKEYFAVKATPNPFLLKIFRSHGLGADCSSLAELILAQRSGITGEEIMFSSNDTSKEDFQLARKLNAIINLDDLTHLPYLEKNAGLPPILSFRYNPGKLKEGNAIIGKPEESKYGLTDNQLFEAYSVARDKGVKRFGIHTMVASNELDPDYFIETAKMLFERINILSGELSIRFEFVNIGGGIGIPYKPLQHAVDLEYISAGIQKEYNSIIRKNGYHPLKFFMECGRIITGPYGFLVSKVLHIKKTYKNFAGLDSCMADLMRPALYGAYHHITIPGKENHASTKLYDVTGSLCENNDKFAIDRLLPELEPGDILVIHDTGAHGHAMGFNYNGKLRSAELLLRKNGDVTLIRRAETPDDYFGTLDFNAVKEFTV
jgi:diaminopimelate decarboxylase